MVREYDTQLLESVAVRRRRLRDALLYGSLRHRRTLDENLTKAFIGLLIAAVLCAGSVGWSFLQHQKLLQQRQQQQQSSGSAGGPPASAASAAPTGAAGWRGKQVTAAMLQTALRRAGISDALYALPAVHKPRAGLESYYFLAKQSGQFVVGVFDRGEERVGRSFTGEDQACRWMYDQIVFPDAPPAKLSARTAVAAKNATRAALTQVRRLIQPAAGGAAASTAVYMLPRGILVDQFGQESGSYLYPDGTPFKERSLPPSTLTTTDRAYPYNYHRYRVEKAFRVRAGRTAPAFAQPGGGVQFHAESGLMADAPELLTLRWLVRNGYLKRVAAD